MEMAGRGRHVWASSVMSVTSEWAGSGEAGSEGAGKDRAGSERVCARKAVLSTVMGCSDGHLAGGRRCRHEQGGHAGCGKWEMRHARWQHRWFRACHRKGNKRCAEPDAVRQANAIVNPFSPMRKTLPLSWASPMPRDRSYLAYAFFTICKQGRVRRESTHSYAYGNY